MPKATANDETIAQCDVYELVEGNVYFPRDSVDMEKLEPSSHSTHCPWKGDARYFHVVTNNGRLDNAAWTYTDPFEKATNIKDHIAFWNGVVVD